jgi:Cu/Ag efflux pump CusA
VWGSADRDPNRLTSLRVPSVSLGSVPLREVAEVRAQTLDDPIVRESGQRVVYVRVWGKLDAVESWADGVGEAATNIALPLGITVIWRRVPRS